MAFAYFHPKQGPRAPYQHNRLGAVFVPGDAKSDDLVASRVWTAARLMRRGVRNGDVLLKIGGSDATKWRTDTGGAVAVAFWARPAGNKLDLTLKRGSETLQKTVVLKDILGPEKMPASGPQK